MKQTLIDPIPCFIPIWTSAINYASLKNTGDKKQEQSAYLYDKFNLNYSSSSACLVGEAHEQANTNNLYWYSQTEDFCRFCDTMCMRQGEQAMVKGGDTLIKFKIKLYNHMVEKHGFKGNIITLDKVPKVGKC